MIATIVDLGLQSSPPESKFRYLGFQASPLFPKTSSLVGCPEEGGYHTLYPGKRGDVRVNGER